MSHRAWTITEEDQKPELAQIIHIIRTNRIPVSAYKAVRYKVFRYKFVFKPVIKNNYNNGGMLYQLSRKSKLCSKIDILVKNGNLVKYRNFVKDRNFGQRSKFWSKIGISGQKSVFLVKNRTLIQKSVFLVFQKS